MQGSQPVRVLWQPPTTGLGISNFEKFFGNFFWKITKNVMSQKTRIWADNFEDNARNSWEYPDSTQLQGKEFQIYKY